jgi:Ni,Fe-hydrogenase maturation factor
VAGNPHDQTDAVDQAASVPLSAVAGGLGVAVAARAGQAGAAALSRPRAVDQELDPETEAAPVLVIGYGNTLRRDDGVGVRAAELIAADPRLAHARVLAVHQLTPELALDIGAVSLVIFVDADARGLPGAIEVHELVATGSAARSGLEAEGGSRDVGAAPGSGIDAGASSDNVGTATGSGIDAGASSHHVGAAELLALARDLAGGRPRAVAVGIGVADLDLGEGLSAPVEAALPRVVQIVADLVVSQDAI